MRLKLIGFLLSMGSLFSTNTMQASPQPESAETLINMFEQYMKVSPQEKILQEARIVSCANNLPGFRHELIPVTKGNWLFLQNSLDLKALPTGDWQLFHDHKDLIGPKSKQSALYILRNEKEVSPATFKNSPHNDALIAIFLQNYVIVVNSQNIKTTLVLRRG